MAYCEYIEFQSTRPLRGATRQAAARAGRPDAFQSTRPLRGATWVNGKMLIIREFQSTRPLRGATKQSWLGRLALRGFNPRAPCGARPAEWRAINYLGAVSIHAPLAGRDTSTRSRLSGHSGFNPRAPCGARQTRSFAAERRTHVSIHAPLAGRD